MIHALRPPLAALRRDTRGLALLEFALGLPVLLVLVLSGIETANYGMAILRIHQIAAVSADNAARVRDSVNEADINEVLQGGKIIGESMDFATRGRIVVSDVLPNGMTGTPLPQTILWQRCAGALNIADSQPQYGLEGKGKADRALTAMGATGRTIAPIANSAMIFVEVTYRYKPVVSNSFNFIGTPIIRSESSFSIRERSGETIGAGPAGTTRSVCTRYDL